MSEVRCRRCGRVLTNPKSIARGFGPVCWRHIHGGRVYARSKRGGRVNMKSKKQIKNLVEVFCEKRKRLGEEPVEFICKVVDWEDCPDPRLFRLYSRKEELYGVEAAINQTNELCKMLNCPHLKPLKGEAR